MLTKEGHTNSEARKLREEMKGMPDYISANLDESVAYFNQALAVEDNFDIIYRVVNFGGRKACIYFIDGFLKD